jgi:uncharacterized protein YllA (UPF0747 family)
MNMNYREWLENKENKPFIETIDEMSDQQKNIASKKFMDMLKVVEAVRNFASNGEGMSTRALDLLEGFHLQAMETPADTMTWLKQAVDNSLKIHLLIGNQENEVRAITAFILMAGVFRGFPVEILDSVEEEAEHVLTYMNVL